MVAGKRYYSRMNGRKKELAVVVVAVALVSAYLATPPKREAAKAKPQGPVRAVQPLGKLKLNLSEEAQWVVDKAIDSYSPRVPIQKGSPEPPL